MKKSIKRIITACVAVVLLAGMLAACGKAAGETPASGSAASESKTATAVDSKETYVYIAPLSNLEYWLQHRKGLEDACAELGVTAKFVGDDGLEADAMCAILETVINDPTTKGIIMQGNFPDAYKPYFQKAWEKGIPICTQTVDVKDSARICYLGCNYVDYGRVMMQQAAEATGGKGDIIVSNNLSAGSPTVEDVMKGIREEVKNWPNMKIVAEIDDQSDAAVAATKIGAALLANSGVTAIIGGQSTSAIGGVTAIKEAGLNGKIKVISIDRDSATLEAISAGDIYSTVAGKQYTEVYYGVKFCYDFNHGSKQAYSLDDAAAKQLVAPSFVDTGSLIINADNVDKFIGFSYAKK